MLKLDNIILLWRFVIPNRVSQLDTGWCASEETEPRRRWTPSSVSVRTLGPEGADCEIPHQGNKTFLKREWTLGGVTVRTFGPEGGWIVRFTRKDARP